MKTMKIKTMMEFALSLCLLGCAACSTEPEKAPAGSATPAVPASSAAPKITYATGFFDEERSDSGAWRWMGPEGVIKLKNTSSEMVLKLTGQSPLGPLKGAPTIKVTFNGETLEEFPGAETVEKQYRIPAAKQGQGETSELRITSSKSFVPQEVDKKFNDTRRLSFMLTKLSWE